MPLLRPRGIGPSAAFVFFPCDCMMGTRRRLQRLESAALAAIEKCGLKRGITRRVSQGGLGMACDPLWRIAVPLGCLLMLSVLYGCVSISPPAGGWVETREMIVTGYCPCGLCCDWERDWRYRPVVSTGPARGSPKKVGVTASGTRARRGTIAADSRYAYGTVMFVDGYGYGRVEDRGRLITGDRLDVFFPTHREAEAWGVRKIKVRIWHPAGGDTATRTIAQDSQVQQGRGKQAEAR